MNKILNISFVAAVALVAMEGMCLAVVPDFSLIVTEGLAAAVVVIGAGISMYAVVFLVRWVKKLWRAASA